jgi:hypothetical protein
LLDLVELEQLEGALDGCAPDQLTGSFPWNVHELAAHVAAGADEVALHVEALLERRAIPRTRQGDEREQPFRDLSEGDLRRVLHDNQERLVSLLDRAMAGDPHAQFSFAGADVPVWAVVTHVRLEAAIHRWDLLGDDEINDRQLASPDLTAHSVMALGPALLEQGLASSDGAPLQARLRADGQADVVIQARERSGVMVLQPPEESDVVVESDAAARLLLLWGRRPSRPGRVRSNVGRERVGRVVELLQGF